MIVRRTGRSARAGFTLIELIVVISILATIAGLALMNMDGTEKDAQLSANMSNQARIKSALSGYFITHNDRYPNNWNSLLDGQTVGATQADFYRGRDTDGDGEPGDADDTNRGIHGHLRGWSGVTATALVNSNQRLIPVKLGAEQPESLVRVYVNRVFDYDSSLTTALADESALNLTTPRTLAQGQWAAMVDPRTPNGAGVYTSLGQTLPTNPTGFVNPIDLSTAGLATTIGSDFVLLAFGLGGQSELIGSSRCGLDSLPLSDEIAAVHNQNFVVVFKVPLNRFADPLLVGVLSPRGESIGVQNAKLKQVQVD